jgi:DNA-binding NarL/FixJ family response regulator
MSYFKTRIIIIEDNEVVKDGFSLILNSFNNYYVVNTYSNCEEAIKNLKKDSPDIVLMDLELPGMNGIQGTKEIKKILPKAEVLVISVYENNELVFEALCAGASGYITKNSGHTEVLSAIEEVLKGGAPMSTKIAKMVVQSFQKSSDSPLSKRESQVLELISQGKTYTMIADHLCITKETAKSHIKNIYSKLEVNTKSEALEIAKRNKLI